MSESVAVVVLSFERHAFLRRQLLYYADRPVHLVFADGSRQAWPHGTSGSLGAMSWEYFHVPGYDTFSERLALAAERVHEDYVCLLDDEECILWSGLQRAASELALHPERSCAGGRVARTVTLRGRLYLAPWGEWSSPWELFDQEPMARFRTMARAERTGNLFYQVMRSRDFKRYTQDMRDFQTSYPNAIEIGLAGFLSVSGTWRMGDYPYWIRHGGSTALPSTAKQTMPPSDSRRIAQTLVRHRPRSGVDLGAEELALNEDDIDDIIQSVWGASPARGDGPGDWRWRRELHVQYHRMRALVGRGLRRYAPGTYIHAHGGSSRTLSFSSYSRVYGDGESKTLRDILLIMAIWSEFPSGIPEDMWAQACSTWEGK